MKFREALKKGLEQDPPGDYDNKMLRAAHAELGARKAASGWSFLARWQVLMPAGAAAAAIAVALVLQPGQKGVAPGGPQGQEFAEMMQDFKLLKDLKVLRKADLWNRVEKQKWRKGKS